MTSDAAAPGLDKRIASFVDDMRSTAVGWLEALVAVRSEAPDERPAQEMVAAIARSVGLDAELRDSDPYGDLVTDPWHVDTGLHYEGRPNCVVTVPGAGAGPLVCNAHIDTVAEGDGWTRDPGGTVVGDRFYGLGSADTKASTVAALLASACVRSMGIEPRMPIELHSVIDEEPGGNGTLSLVREIVAGDLRRPQLVVVMEPSRLDVLSGHRGMLWHRIECLGVQTHGSGTDGVNAIEIAAEVVLRLRALNQDFSRWSEGTYPAPRVNVGIVAGGHEVYTTPGRATLDVSARYAPGQRDAVEQAVLAAVRGKGTSGPADIRAMLWSDFDAAETDERDPAVASVLAAIQDLRPDAEVSRLMGTCDMRHYARELGVPTVIFGPGDLAVAHAADEYVDLDEVFTAARALASLSVRGIGSGGRHEPEGD